MADAEDKADEEVEETEADTAEKSVRSAPPESVVISLKAAAGAPQLKSKKFKVTGSTECRKIVDHIQRLLKKDRVYCYVSAAHLLPALDEPVGTLAVNYGRLSSKIGWTLNFDYAEQPTWG
eukprot:m.38147 g.38147  ORF g.38147 m.38147 type:complete len:121 (-) comp11614_c0_seq1:449-811(-)